MREEAEVVQGETEAMVERLQVGLESYSECLKRSQEVFKDHDNLIQGILKESVKRIKNYQMKSAQESLDIVFVCIVYFNIT